MSRQESSVGTVVCPVCDLRLTVATPNEAIELYRRHVRITGHDIEWERTTLNATAESIDVESTLKTLSSDHADGVSLGLLTVALADRDITIAETLNAVYDLRMKGAVYEPRDDHLLVT